jgi:uncharacterized protein YecT (DUF1311 family)
MRCRSRALRSAVLAAYLLWTGSSGAAQPAPAYPNTEGFGVPFSTNEEWYRHCMRVERLVPPRPPKPGKLRCDATELYYLKRDQASTSAAEWRQVRDCAEATGNDAVLMMMYANGYGMARDTERAIHHACKLDTAKAEMEIRIAYLASPAAASERHPFDLCDHITSGRMGGVCAAIGEDRDDRVRAARLDRFATSLPATARAPFARLRQAADAFAKQSAAEVDMTGTGGPGFATQHAGRRDQEFMETLLKAASGKLPSADAAQLARLDQELNAQYRTVLGLPSENENHPERIRYSTVEREDVRSTERAWLAYRDAWEAFTAAARLPADVISIKAMLTRQRIAQLKRI